MGGQLIDGGEDIAQIRMTIAPALGRTDGEKDDVIVAAEMMEGAATVRLVR